MKLRLARALVEKGETADALQLLEDPDGRFRKLIPSFWLNLLLARLHWSDDRQTVGLAHLVSALEISRRDRLSSLLVPERHWIVPCWSRRLRKAKCRAISPKLWAIWRLKRPAA